MMIQYDKSYLKFTGILLILLLAGCFEEREFMWEHEVLEWEPPDKSTNALSMTITFEDDETSQQTVSLRMQYAGPHKNEDAIGTFAIDEQNSGAVEGVHFEIQNESNSVTIPAGSNFSEEINIQIYPQAIERGEELNLVLLITDDGDIPPMENYKEFNLLIYRETGFLPVGEFTLTNPGSNSGDRVVDLTTTTTYTTLDGDEDTGIQELIDFGMWNSSTYDFVMIVPTDSDRLGGWGSGRRVRDDWVHKNDGILMKLPFDEDNQNLFENILTAEDLTAAYDEAEETITNLGLEQDDYGPGGHLQYVTQGELIFFQSLDRDFHAILYVEEAEIASDGFATFLVKITLEEE